MPRPKSPNLAILYDRLVGDDPRRVDSYEAALADSEIAGHVYALRTEAALSQAELAARVGTTEEVISSLEDADYDGHAFSMLRRIAVALGRRAVVTFPLETETR